MNKVTKKQETKKPFAFTNMQKFLFFFALAVVAAYLTPIMIVLVVGLLPTITIILTDKKNFNKMVIVGCFNLAGIFFYLIMILNDFSMNEAVKILTDVFNLMVMLISAAIGLIVYFEVPQFFIAIAQSGNEKRLENITKKLEKIREEWGGDSTAKSDISTR